MKNLLNSFLIIVSGMFLMSLSKCSSLKEQHNYYNNIYVIDTNEKKVFDNARIKGAINLSLKDAKTRSKEFNKDFKLIFYCSDYFCIESDKVAKAFYNLGFKNLFVYKGGIQEWYQFSQKTHNSLDYQIEGSLKDKEIMNFLTGTITKPKESTEENTVIKIITAPDLSKLLKANTNKAA